MKGIIVEHKGFYAFACFYPDDGYYHGSIENFIARFFSFLADPVVILFIN